MRIHPSGSEVPILYGRTAAHGILAFPGTTGNNLPFVPAPGNSLIGSLGAQLGSHNKFLLTQYVLGVGEIGGVFNVWNGDEPIRTGRLQGELVTEWRNGGQASDMATRFCSAAGFGGRSGNGSGERTANDKFTGKSFLTVVARHDRDDPKIFGVPQPLCALEGNVLNSIERSGDTYRLSGSRNFSANFVQVLLDYMTSADYGPRLSVDDIDLPSWYTAQQQSRQAIQGPGSTVSRVENDDRRAAGYAYVESDGALDQYTDFIPGSDTGLANTPSSSLVPRSNQPDMLHRHEYNGPVSTSQDFPSIIQQIVATVPSAMLFYATNGKWKLSIGDPTRTAADQSVMTVDDSMLLEPVIRTTPDSNTKLGAATVNFADMEKDFTDNSVTWPEAGGALRSAFLAQDNGQRLETSINLPGVNNHFAARSIAAQAVLLSRRDGYQVRAVTRAALIEPGDVFRIVDSALGIDSYVRAARVALNEDLSVTITAIEFRPSDYSWQFDEKLALQNLAAYSDDVGTPQSATLTIQGQLATVQWIPASEELATVVGYEIQRSDDGGRTWYGKGSVDADTRSWTEIPSLEAIMQLQYRVRAYTSNYRRSGWATATAQSIGAYRGGDSDTYEEVFRLTTSTTAPGTPASSSEQREQNGYIPSGWSNRRSGLDTTNRYEWVSFRTKASADDAQWSEFSTPALIAHFAVDGALEESVFRVQASPNPPVITTTTEQDGADDFVPAGWSDDPVSPDANRRWSFWAIRTRASAGDSWGKFTVALLSVYTADGRLNEAVYRATDSNSPPSITTTVDNDNTDDFVPTGWSDDPISPTAANRFVWISVRRREKVGDTWGKFVTPALISSFAVDGLLEEQVFRVQASPSPPSITTTQQQDAQDDFVPAGWNDDPVSPDANRRWSFWAIRTRASAGDSWGKFQVTLLSVFSGDGKLEETVYFLGNSETAPAITTTDAQDRVDDFVPSGWNDDPLTVSASNRFLWISVRRRAELGDPWGKFISARLLEFHAPTANSYNVPTNLRSQVITSGGNKFIRLTWGRPATGSLGPDGRTVRLTGYSGFAIRYGSASTNANIQYGRAGASITTVDMGPVYNGDHFFTFAAQYSDGGISGHVSGTVTVTGAPDPDAPVVPTQAPGVPGVPTLVASTTNSLTLQTAASGSGGVATGFTWRYSTDSSVTDADPAVTSSTNRVTITGLGPNRSFWVDVRAENAAGNSAYSADGQFTTAATPQAVYNPPTGLNAVRVAGDNANVAWTAPTGSTLANGDAAVITGYDVEYKLSTASSYGNRATVTATGITLSPLQPGTRYDVRVRAKFGLFSSAWVDISFTTIADDPPGVPGVPTLVSSTSSSLTLTCTAPTSGETPTRYRWRYSTNSTVSDADPNVTSTTNRVTITGLTANTPYWIDVRAENDAGNSAYSADGNFRTAATAQAVYNPPTGLFAVRVAEDNANVAWTAPTGSTLANGDAAVITGYDVEYKVSTASSFGNRATVTATGITLSSLQSATAYDVRVRAKFGLFSSAWVDISFTTERGQTAIGRYNPPTNLTFGRQRSQFQARWNAPTGSVDSNGQSVNPFGYTVEYKRRVDSSWTNANVQTGVATRVGSAEDFGIGIDEVFAMESHGGTLYMLARESFDYALYTVNTLTGVATKVGSADDFGVGETRPAALASHGGTLYMAGNTNDVLYRLNTSTGVATRVGFATRFGLDNVVVRGLASHNGNLLLLLYDSSAGPIIYTLDTSRGSARAVSSSGIAGISNSDNVSGITSQVGTLYVLSANQDAIYSVNVDLVNFQVTATRVGSADDFGVGETQPVALASHSGTLYMIGNRFDVLYTLNLNPTPVLVETRFLTIDGLTSNTNYDVRVSAMYNTGGTPETAASSFLEGSVTTTQ